MLLPSWRDRLFTFFKHSNGGKTNQRVVHSLLEQSRIPLSQLFANLKTTESGLHEGAIAKRREIFGWNEVAHEKAPTWYALLLGGFINPFVILLLVLAVISFFLKQKPAFIIMGSMVLIGVFMRFIQEYRSNLAAEKLKNLVSTKATVQRLKGQVATCYEVNIKYLVPGDVIHLSAGDIIPADVRLITAKGLYVSQGALTGESLPVDKEVCCQGGEEVNNPVELSNLCFMGTSVLNGVATAVILNIGNKTYFGSMAKAITGRRSLTSFDIGISKVSWLLIRFILVIVPIVFLLNTFTKGDWLESFLFALSVAVGLTPEMLPMIVTTNLARGAISMSRHKVVVKKLNAIQNFGAMNILCTDKTGTLTQDRVILEKYLNAAGEENEEVLSYGYLNSYYQTGLKNLLDVAVLEHRHLETDLDLHNLYEKIDEVPFDFTRRRMSVVLKKKDQQCLLICKGAFDEVLSVCNMVKKGNKTDFLSEDIRKTLKEKEQELNRDGLRVLAVAYREFSFVPSREYQPSDERELVFIGYLAFLDPPKLSTAKALAFLKQYNVGVKVLTGDNELVTGRICQLVDLAVEGVLTGPTIDEMDDQELRKTVDGITIFAKVTPLQKSRVIAALKANGHVVGYLGDGINDAPALKEADVGISVDTATDIAKESADIIMLEKDLLFLGNGVLEGRKTFGNIIKYIKMATSSNFGNVFSILGASILLPFLPMLPVQLLTQNLLYDFSQMAIPFDHVDAEFLRSPRKWDAKGIAKFMLFIGPVSSLFDYVTFALLWFGFKANSIEMQSLFQSGWFIEGLLSQVLIVHMIRTNKIPFLQSIASVPLLLTSVIIIAIGIFLPYSSIGHSIGLISLPVSYFYFLTVILLSYCLATQIVKSYFIKRVVLF